MTPPRLTLAAGLLLGLSPALAQESPPGTDTRVVLTPYLWLPGIEGSITSRRGRELPQGGASASFSDVVPNLQGVPFVGAMEVGHGRFSALADLITIGTRTEAKPRLGYFYNGGNLDVRTTMGSLAGYYRVVDTPAHTLDIGAGIRVTAINSTLRLNAGRLPAVRAEADTSHVDGIAAARYNWRFAPSWSTTLAGDVGGGGSRVSWQVLGSVNWHVTDRTVLRLGWRHLGIDQSTRRDGNISLNLTGPFLAASFRF